MVGSSSIILPLYVDDMLVAGSDMVEIKKLKRQMSQEFELKDLGSAKQMLGMSIVRDKTKDTLKLSQEKYIGKVLERFNIKDAEARSVGSVMYDMVCTMPNIAHVVGVVSRFMSSPGKEHWKAVKWLLRYLKGTLKATLCTMPNIAHIVGVVSRFMSSLRKEHWEVVKWLLRYLKGTLKATLCFSKKEVVLE
ncbi:retrovirus-related pol polyprotein from transposon TNT 1-94, partial [Tanacetum coccineum]